MISKGVRHPEALDGYWFGSLHMRDGAKERERHAILEKTLFKSANIADT